MPALPRDRHPRKSTTTQTVSESTQDFDVDREIVDSVDESIWNAINEGHFRLAIKCDVCSRWCTSLESKVAGRGPRCAQKRGDG
jgi:hypothetical protein